jgi:uncharacterized membrane protein YgcG
MKLLVQVDPRRVREGTLTLYDAGDRVLLGPVPVCATADAAVARRMNNAVCDPLRPGGHAPLGTYRLAKVDALDAAERNERGPYALSFEPVAGDALHAESFGRLLLDLHGGAPGSDGRLRATSGGLRVDDQVLEELAVRLRDQANCELQLQAVKESWWSRLFRLRRSVSDDESSDRETSWSSRDSSSSEPVFSGRGGASGGAGASGSWDTARPSAAALATGAAVAAGAAVVAGAALAAGDAAASGEAMGADATAADSDSAETATSTSY